MYTKDSVLEDAEKLNGMFPRLEEWNWHIMDREVTKDEVKEAIMATTPLKTPGPDRFHAMFYQKSWDIVGDSMHNLVKRFSEDGVLPNRLNETNIVLIPKEQNPETISQLRPISLCNVAYKLVTKVITNRLKNIMSELVCPNQSSFVKER